MNSPIRDFLPTHDAEIDAARLAVRRGPTHRRTFLRHKKCLYAWIWYLVRTGRDVRGVDRAMKELARARNTPRKFSAVDQGFQILEGVFLTPPLAEFKGTPTVSILKASSDWPRYHGNSHQTGATRDAGPTLGKVAWSFATGQAWYSRPAVAGREVFACSPGLRKQLFCFDLASGSTKWSTDQPGCELYRTPSIRSSPVVLGNGIVVREAGSGGSAGEAKHVVTIDRRTGRVIHRTVVGHIDYRAGWAPVVGGDAGLVVPIGRHDIRTRPVYTEPMHALRCLEPATLKTRWEAEVGAFYAEPVVAGARAVVATDCGILAQLRMKDGGRNWAVDLAGSLRAAPTVHGPGVFVGGNDGEFYCIEADSGRVSWQVRLIRPEPRAFRLFSSACVSGDRVYVGDARAGLSALDAKSGGVFSRVQLPDWVRSRPVVIRSGMVVVATLAGTVHGFAWSGSRLVERWRVHLARCEILADLVCAGNRILLNAADLTLHCLDGDTGATLWRKPLLLGGEHNGQWVCADQVGGGATCQSPATVATGRVFFGSPGHFVYGLNTRNGRQRWRFEAPGGAVSAAPVYARGRLYFGQQGGTDQFLCIDARTGRPVWHQRLGWVWASANIVGQKVFVAGVDGRASCLSLHDGRILWQRSTGGGLYPAPAVGHGRVFFGSWDQHYYCLRTRDGTVVWKAHTGGEPDSGAPCWSSGRIYFPCIGGFFCRDARTGKLLWRLRHRDYAFNASPSISAGRLFASGHLWRQHFDVETWVGTDVRCLSARDGKQHWCHAGGGLTHVSVAGNTAYFGSTGSPFFQAVDVRGDGRGSTTVRWRVALGDRVEEPCPAISGGRAYLLAANGIFYAIE